MELSAENENHVKLSYILLNIVAKHLRTYFVKLWDEKYPDEKWQDDVAKRNFKLQSLIVKDVFTRKILNGNHEEWNTSILLKVLSDSRLKLIEIRPHNQNSNQLIASEGLETLRDIRSAFDDHLSSMAYSSDDFKETMTRIKSVARNIFGEDAEKEIEEIESSPSTQLMTEQLKEFLEVVDPVIEVDLSPEKKNYRKLAYILFEVAARHLRTHFVKLWNDKYPDEKWLDDIDKRNLKFHGLLVKGMYTPRILNGNEQTWDTTTLTHAIVGAGLKLTEGSRPQKQRSGQLLASEEIEIIRNVRNSFYGHVLSMSCSEDKFKDVMKSIKSVARNIFGEDAEKEIEKFENSPVTAMMTKHAEKQLQDELKERYKIQHERHKIHQVDRNRRIVMKEVRVDEFAVKLRMNNAGPCLDTFRGEKMRHLAHLEGMKGKYIELSDLTNHRGRVTLISAIAGMGKSVISKQLTYRWANGEIYTQYKFCLMMECRDINYFVLNEGADLQRHEIFSEFLKSKFEYDLGDAAGTLFIVDGLDELSDIKESDSIIWQLLDIDNSKYTKAKIILTGRPQVETELRSNTRRQMGGMQKVEVLGLSEEQVNDYIRMFSCCEEDVVKINKTKDSSRAYLPVLYVPQFLNSLCCVAILSERETVRSAAELYCWILYLLLKQHAEKEGSREKLCSEIFKEYSSELLALSKICHELLNDNKIIFEGNIPSQLLEGDKGKAFFEGLFTDVSDNRKRRFQFKHLTLMEFLSAVYVCGMKSRLEIIKNNIGNGFYQVALFSCQLIAGFEYDGIIQDMFIYDEELKAVNVPIFLLSVLKPVSQCFAYTDDECLSLQPKEQSFQQSIEIIMCFANKDVINKELIVSTIKTLYYQKLELSTESLKMVNDMCKNLIKEYSFSKEHLKEVLKDVIVELVIVDDLNVLTSLHYFASVREIELKEMETCVSFIQNKLSEVTKCEKVVLKLCNLVDDKIIDRSMANSDMKWVRIDSCQLSQKSFINIFKWVASTSVEELTFISIDKIEESWWEELADAIVVANEKQNRSLALTTLKIASCTQMISTKWKIKIMKCGVSVNGKKFPPLPAVVPSDLNCKLDKWKKARQSRKKEIKLYEDARDLLLQMNLVTPPASLPPPIFDDSCSSHQQQRDEIEKDAQPNAVTAPMPPSDDVACNQESSTAIHNLAPTETPSPSTNSTTVITAYQFEETPPVSANAETIITAYQLEGILPYHCALL